MLRALAAMAIGSIYSNILVKYTFGAKHFMNSQKSNQMKFTLSFNRKQKSLKKKYTLRIYSFILLKYTFRAKFFNK